MERMRGQGDGFSRCKGAWSMLGRGQVKGQNKEGWVVECEMFLRRPRRWEEVGGPAKPQEGSRSKVAAGPGRAGVQSDGLRVLGRGGEREGQARRAAGSDVWGEGGSQRTGEEMGRWVSRRRVQGLGARRLSPAPLSHLARVDEAHLVTRGWEICQELDTEGSEGRRRLQGSEKVQGQLWGLGVQAMRTESLEQKWRGRRGCAKERHVPVPWEVAEKPSMC